MRGGEPASPFYFRPRQPIVLLRTFISTEENSILLVSQHRNQVARRIGWLRLETEPGLLRGPIDGGSRREERTHKPLPSIVNLRRLDRPIPLHVEGDGSTYGGHWRDGGIGKAQITGEPQPKSQRIGDVVVVEDLQVPHLQACLGIVEINLKGIVGHLHHPEHIVGIYVYVEVVNLFGEFGRSSRTGIHVKSNKGEGAFVEPTVTTDELALAETHVRLVSQRGSLSGFGVGSGAAPANVRQSNEAVEISYL